MDHPKRYLLGKVIHNRTNGLSTLGELNAKHIDDISNVMFEYAEEMVNEVIDRLNKGEEIEVGGRILSLTKSK